MGGLRLGLTLFTIVPLRVSRVDRRTARAAMIFAPLIGAMLGGVLAGLALLLRLAGAAPLVTAAALTATLVLATRGLHLDGLADTADGLGSYQTPEKALQIMKKSDIGPFGVAAIAVVLLLDTATLSSVLARPWPAALAGVTVAVAAGRLGAGVTCRRGLPAARPEGLGALVAETLPVPVVLLSVLALAAAGVLAGPVRGPLAVLLAAGTAWALTAHAGRRLGGMTGDVIGAAVEAGTAVALLTLATGGPA